VRFCVQVVGRLKPSAQKGTRKSDIYKMNVFAPNKVVAKSRFWYYMSMLNRVKKANGEILQINEVPPAPVRPSGVQGAQRTWARAPQCGWGFECTAVVQATCGRNVAPVAGSVACWDGRTCQHRSMQGLHGSSSWGGFAPGWRGFAPGCRHTVRMH
jgi:hypothetical protein